MPKTVYKVEKTCYNINMNKVLEELILENTIIKITNDMAELAEQYEYAASNERLWAKGAPDQETAEMHESNAAECAYLADVYRKLSENPQMMINALED